MPLQSAINNAAGAFGQGIQAFGSLMNVGYEEEKAALTREMADRQRKEYEDNMTPVPIGQMAGKIPEDMRPAFLDMGATMGIIKGAGKEAYILKKDIKEFFTEFSKNPMAQAQVLQSSYDLTRKKIGELEQISAPVKDSVSKMKASYDQDLRSIYDEAAKKSIESGTQILPDERKIQKIKQDMQKWEAADPGVKELQKYQKQMVELESTRISRLKALGIIDERYKKDEELFGRETAIAIAQNHTTRDKELYKIKYIDAQAKAQAHGEEVRQTAQLTEALKGQREVKNIETKGSESRKTEEVKTKGRKEVKAITPGTAPEKAKESYATPEGDIVTKFTDGSMRDVNGRVLAPTEVKNLKKIDKGNLDFRRPSDIKGGGKKESWRTYLPGG
jgi:hypothetical protein